MINALIDLLPESSKLALSAAIAIGGYVVGHLVEDIASKASESAGLRRHIRFGLEKQLGKVGINADILGLFGKIIKYIIYLVAALLIAEVLGFGPASELLREVLMFTPNVVGAIAIIIVASVATEFISDLVKFSLKSNGIDALLEEGGFKFKVSGIAAAFVRYLFYSTIIVIALAQLGFHVLELTIMVSSLWVVAVSTAALFMFFGLKEMLPNIFAGLYLRNSRQLSAGDRISFRELKGTVRRIGLMNSEIEVGKGVACIPNICLIREIYCVTRAPQSS